MRRIFKYELAVDDVCEVFMPSGAEILCIQVQHGVPRIWAKVDPDAPKVRRMFRTYGTGHPMDDVFDDSYVGTYQIHNEELVFHVFERIS